MSNKQLDILVEFQGFNRWFSLISVVLLFPCPLKLCVQHSIIFGRNIWKCYVYLLDRKNGCSCSIFSFYFYSFNVLFWLSIYRWSSISCCYYCTVAVDLLCGKAVIGRNKSVNFSIRLGEMNKFVPSQPKTSHEPFSQSVIK